jgi:Tat protein secretion system quality control protein TatD with DNase activity
VELPTIVQNMREDSADPSHMEKWDGLVLVDAHCHPTDFPSTLNEIATMKASKLIVMTTRLEDIDSVEVCSRNYSEKIIPAFGYHPWFSHKVYIQPPESKWHHYSTVLKPCPTREFVDTLPEPKPFVDHLKKMRQYLIKHPHAMVGELGLDRAFRLPMDVSHKGTLSPYHVDLQHQLKILNLQLELAAEFNRSVSLHGVHAHNALFESVLRILGPTNCKICLHSYSGSADFLASNWLKVKPLRNRVYVSCSVLINIPTDERAKRIVEFVPEERILTESDYHAGGSDMDQYIWAALARICRCYNWSLEEGSSQVAKNFSHFVESAGV